MSQAVRSADEARHRLYEIMSQDGPFEEKAKEALELGTTYLGVDTGFVSRINPSTDHYETIVSTDGDEGLVPAGMKTNLNSTYCRHTLERDSPLALHDVEESQTIEATDGMHCYHGTTLTVDGEPYGTVCFVAAEPRGEPFSEAETMFAELIGRLLGHELEHQRHSAELVRKTSLVNVLDRVLRHNIRNDMTVIRANARLHAEEHGGDSEECSTIIKKANELIEMSESARELGQIINADFEPREVDVSAIVEGVVAEATDKFPAASFTVEAPETARIEAQPSLRTALWELLENAATYAGDAPEVTVSIRETPDSVEIRVIDDGPGLPEPEQDALQAGTETKLVHGSGIGLWTVYWVATTHQGRLDIDTEDGTAVTLGLPRHGDESPDDSVEESEPTDRTLEIPRAPDRYRAVFENTETALLLLDDDGRILDANEQAGAEFGRDPATMTGRHAQEFVSTDGVFDPFDAAEGEVTVSRPDGRHDIDYVLNTDIVPGQHLAVLFEDS